MWKGPENPCLWGKTKMTIMLHNIMGVLKAALPKNTGSRFWRPPLFCLLAWSLLEKEESHTPLARPGGSLPWGGSDSILGPMAVSFLFIFYLQRQFNLCAMLAFPPLWD